MVLLCDEVIGIEGEVVWGEEDDGSGGAFFLLSKKISNLEQFYYS
jgi:hypothetical protein